MILNNDKLFQKKKNMKFQLKHLVWLRNILLLLFSILTIDFLVKKFYDGVPTSGMKFPMIIGLFSIIALELQIKKQKKATNQD